MTPAVRGCLLSVALLVVLPVAAQFPPSSTQGTIELANAGDIKAQVNLGYAYYVAKNYDEALKWFHKAADHGGTDPSSAYAYFALGSMAQEGLGVKQDSVRAYVFLGLAKALGNQEAKTLLEKVTSNLTPAQLAQAQTELLETVTKNAQAEEKSELSSLRASFKFVKEQRVYVVAVESSSRNLDVAKADLLLERLTKDQFKKRKAFRVANTLNNCDFVFFVVLDADSRSTDEVALVVLPTDYERAGARLDDLRNHALWQANNHVTAKAIAKTMIPIGGPIFLHPNVVAGLVKQFHRDALGK